MEMPPLPTRLALWRGDETFHLDPDGRQLEAWRDYDLYAADQLRTYGELCARLAREEERERCAKLAEMQGLAGHAISENTAAWCAAAIRSES